MALVGTSQINNVDIEIHASKHGSWSILLPENQEGRSGKALGTHHTSLEAAINLARIEIRRRQVKVAVPFKTREGKKGVADSRHARSQEKILATVAGKREQIGFREQTFKSDTPRDVFQRLDEIDIEMDELRGEERSLIREWSLDLGKALDAAIDKKQEGQT